MAFAGSPEYNVLVSMGTKEEQFEKLREGFIAEFSAELDSLLGDLLAAKREPANVAQVVTRAGEYFHRLSGVAETFGMATLGRLAGVVDGMVDLTKNYDKAALVRIADLAVMAVEATRDSLREHSHAQRREPVMIFPDSRERVIKEPVFENGKKSTVAIVDDDKTSGEIIDVCLTSAGYSTFLISDPAIAVEELSTHLPDLILLDVAMPGIDGFQLCERLRQNPALSLVPIVFVTAKNDTAQKVRGLTVGGNDYIEKPFSPDELVARVAAHLERLRTIRELAIRDSLTGVYNHKYFESLVDQELKRGLRYNLPLSFALLDVDHFKGINDKHGHLTGDSVLSRFVRVVSGQLRTSDMVGRWGGDEFAVILTQTPLAAAHGVMRRIVLAVSNIIAGPTGPEQLETRVTTSIGVAGIRAEDTLQSFLARADKALYRAKESGRARAEVETESD
jgi:diguanylate cyclase (GGDEF)-like protein